MNREYILKAQEVLEKRREENKRLGAERRREISEKFPEMRGLEVRLAGTMDRFLEVMTGNFPDKSARYDEIQRENLEIQEKMTELLTKNGYPKDYLDEIFTCKKCSDSGSVGGQWCECLEKTAVKLAADELNRRSPLGECSFEGFLLEKYPDEPNEKGVVPRKFMEKNLNVCRNFAEKFPDVPDGGLLMLGKPGLGKTRLSLSVANRLIQRGFSVVYNTVPELLRAMNAEQFGRGSENTSELISQCDLLILDDLGAENATSNAVSLLYQAINARCAAAKPYIVNSNLTTNEIRERYQDRLYSRLLSLEVLYFFGNDIRLEKYG